MLLEKRLSLHFSIFPALVPYIQVSTALWWSLPYSAHRFWTPAAVQNNLEIFWNISVPGPHPQTLRFSSFGGGALALIACQVPQVVNHGARIENRCTWKKMGRNVISPAPKEQSSRQYWWLQGTQPLGLPVSSDNMLMSPVPSSSSSWGT